MKVHADIKISNGVGFGPAAWGGDTHKVNMHPPIPGHIEFVEEAAKSHTKHHMVTRRHPENDNEETLYRREITPEDMGYKVHAQKHHILRHLHPDRKNEGVPIRKMLDQKGEA